MRDLSDTTSKQAKQRCRMCSCNGNRGSRLQFMLVHAAFVVLCPVRTTGSKSLRATAVFACGCLQKMAKRGRFVQQPRGMTRTDYSCLSIKAYTSLSPSMPPLLSGSLCHSLPPLLSDYLCLFPYLAPSSPLPCCSCLIVLRSCTPSTAVRRKTGTDNLNWKAVHVRRTQDLVANPKYSRLS